MIRDKKLTTAISNKGSHAPASFRLIHSYASIISINTATSAVMTFVVLSNDALNSIKEGFYFTIKSIMAFINVVSTGRSGFP